MLLVYAIEASTMADQAKIVVESNAMQDRITVIHGKIEVSISKVFTFCSSINGG